MVDEKQYFDSWKVENDALWVIDKEQSIEAPLHAPVLRSSTPGATIPGEIVLQTEIGGWWYSRKKYRSKPELEEEVKKLTAAIRALKQNA